MVKGKARAAGSFLGGLANNPAIVIIALVLGGLFIFRDRISEAFGSLGEGLGNLQFPELPSLPDFNFPDFNFPDITFPSFEFPDFNIEFPSFDFDFGDPFGDAAKGAADFFGGLQEQFNDFVSGITPDDPAGTPDLSIGLAGGIQERRRAQEEALALAAIPDRDIQDDIEGLTPAQSFAFIERGVIPTGFQLTDGVLTRIMEQIAPAAPIPADPFSVSSFLVDEPTQQFTGGGVSFMGGSIFETPIEFLSLNQIIERFGVSASRAASLRAEAIGFTPEEEQFLAGSGDVGGFSTGFNPPAVSDPQFEGLTPEEIALRLTGGNISNF